MAGSWKAAGILTMPALAAVLLAGCAEVGLDLDDLRDQASQHASDLSSHGDDLLSQAQNFGAEAQTAIEGATTGAEDAAQQARDAIAALEGGQENAEQRVADARTALDEAQAQLDELKNSVSDDQLATIEAERDQIAQLLTDLKGDLESAQ
ncbi:hypothetical protein [Jonesia quinghaiensis]|uniref:hypothetical protein n=1 Tax=Jonesia quinghaiensis TaxID=262806 RepID=UPI000400C223|nr:hypothetical protein [Jonesia quinghaiensis]